MEHHKFVEAMQRCYSATYVLATSSGTGALMAALYGSGLAAGEKVIIPVNSCPAVLNAIVLLGLIPVFCDVDHDMQLNGDHLQRLIAQQIKAIIVVHRFGGCTDMDKLATLLNAARYQGVIIEDGAQAFGVTGSATLKPKGVSDVYISSFGSGKIVDTDGGGVLLTNNNELFKLAHRFINHGADQVPFFKDFGVNFGISRYLLPLITEQIVRVDSVIEMRINHAQTISQALVPFDFRPVQDPGRCVYYRMVLEVPKGHEAKKIVQYARERNCMIREAFPFLLKDYDYIKNRYPNLSSESYPIAEAQKTKYISLYVDKRFNEETLHVLRNISLT